MSEWNEGTGTGPEILKNGKRMTATEIFNGLMEAEQLQAHCADLTRKLELAKLAEEFDPAPEDSDWGKDHPIFQMAANIDRLESEKAELEATIRQRDVDALVYYSRINELENLCLELESEKAQQQERIAAIKSAGTILSNIAFNLKQKNWMPEHEAELLGDAQKHWDNVAQEPTPHPAESEGK